LIPSVLLALAVVKTTAADYVKLPLAAGFDFPVGKPDSSGYYKARGFWPNGHMGEDWNGKGGGNTDLGDPVYSIGDGIVVQSRDVRVGWGNVVIVRHVFRDSDGQVKYIDSLYGHLNARNVVLNQRVKKGQKLGSIGTNRGMYLAHLHLETRKNLYIGMHRSKFSKTYANYHSPTSFIRSHRQCPTSSKLYRVPINTFAPYPGGTPVARNGQTPALSSSKSKSLSIPVRRTSSYSPPPSSRVTSNSRPKSTPTKLDPKVQKIIADSKKKEAKPPEPKPKRKGLLSKLRSRFSSKDKDSKSPTRRRGFSRGR
jgi:hypothetical protein